jgi:hypothetical protein
MAERKGASEGRLPAKGGQASKRRPKVAKTGVGKATGAELAENELRGIAGGASGDPHEA